MGLHREPRSRPRLGMRGGGAATAQTTTPDYKTRPQHTRQIPKNTRQIPKKTRQIPKNTRQIPLKYKTNPKNTRQIPKILYKTPNYYTNTQLLYKYPAYCLSPYLNRPPQCGWLYDPPLTSIPPGPPASLQASNTFVYVYTGKIAISLGKLAIQ